MKYKINRLAEIYKDNDLESFYVGFIKYYDTNILVAECFDRYGGYSGYLVVKLSKINKISYNTKYLKKMSLLIEERKELNIKSFEDVINLSINNNRLVEGLFKRKQFEYNFQILDFNNDLLVVRYIDNYCKVYKEESININNIYCLIIDDNNLRSLEKILFQKNKIDNEKIN